MDKQTILIVDDIPDNIKILCFILKDDYNIKIANNGETALKIAFSGKKIDLILLDIMMPGIDGYEVCTRLKNDIQTKNIPVIFVTAKNEIIDEYKGFQVGAVDYIPKPVSPSIVKARVATHLALYDQNRELEKKVKYRTEELQDTRLEIIRHLGRAAEYKDYHTGLHVIRISKYSQQIALSYGLDEAEAVFIMNVAPMHDIGKIGIPDKILLKPGKLNKEEWKIMKTHPVIGSEIIKGHSSELLKQAKIAAFTHHEKWNGTGYPAGISGEDIPLIGRIIAVSDVFDALTNERPYKKAWPAEDAIDHINREKGKHFDPKLVDAFFKCLPEIRKIMTKYKEKNR